jgi:two-component system cell cycle sensor histidine kinase/response regulator CckA
MKDPSGTNREVLEEISTLRQRIKELEQSETIHKQTEEALLESEAKYRAVVESSLVGVFVIQDGLFRLVNERWCEIYGYIYDEAVGKMSPWDLIHPEDKKIIEENVRKRLSGEADYTESEMRAIRKDGTIITVRVLSSFMLYKGRPGSSGTIIDITEHKKVEEQLRQKTALLEAQIHASPDGILIIDKDRKILQNQQVNDLLRIPKNIAEDNDIDVLIEWVKSIVINPEEYIEKRSHRVTHPDEITYGELEFKDGTVLERYSGPVIGEDGERYGTVIRYRDITERKRSEEALRISQSRLAEAMDLANIVYWEVDPADNAYIFNDPFYAFYGTTAEKEGGYRMSREEYFKRFVHPDDRSNISPIVAQRMSTADLEILHDIEHRIIRRDGEVRRILVRSRAVKGKSGRIIKRYGANQDITQRKQSEEEKTHLESQLLQSQKMEAIGTLAGGIAHDFNNVLTVIRGFSSLLRMDMGENDPKKAYIDQILSSSEKAAQLTRGLLAFSRKQQISLKPLDINSTIKVTAKLLKTLLTEDIELKTKLSEETAIVMADASQMDQILFNLATNARDAMPHGGAFVVEAEIVELDDDFIRIHGYGESGNYALLCVSDTGIGMDEATKSKIFDPFFTTKEVGRGTGLGLSTVYGIVKQHNGYITVYSKPGKGTTFHIYLPLINQIINEEKEAQVPIKGGNETILIAEDDDAVRGLIKTVLTEHGYSIIEAIDGEDAIDRFVKTEKRIDLIILDTVMPKKNGREVYDEIKRIKPDSKVIFTSGYTRDIILDKGMAEGDTFEFIPKPISPYVLLLKVRQVLDDSEDSR